MSIHHLKIQRQPFEDLVSGRKTGEVRNCADREFREGDQVELFLIDETGNPANKSIVRTITHIQRGFGLPDDICVLSYATHAVEPTLREHCKQCAEVVKTWTESKSDCLGPVVERQPVALPAEDDGNYDYGGYNEGHKHGWNDYREAVEALGPLYTAPPELAELQATIIKSFKRAGA